MTSRSIAKFAVQQRSRSNLKNVITLSEETGIETVGITDAVDHKSPLKTPSKRVTRSATRETKDEASTNSPCKPKAVPRCARKSKTINEYFEKTANPTTGVSSPKKRANTDPSSQPCVKKANLTKKDKAPTTRKISEFVTTELKKDDVIKSSSSSKSDQSQQTVAEEPVVPVKEVASSVEVVNGVAKKPLNAEGVKISKELLAHMKKLKGNPLKALKRPAEIKPNQIKLKAEDDGSTIESHSSLSDRIKLFKPTSSTNGDNLTLPRSYENLLETFNKVESVVQMLFNRGQKAVWENLARFVAKMTRKEFTIECLRQIRYVFPQAFEFEYVHGTCHENGRIGTRKYHLVVTPNVPKESSIGGEKKFTSEMKNIRRQQFRFNLMCLLKHHHQEFVKSELGLTCDNDKINHWHPKFLLTPVPEVPMANFVASPNEQQLTARQKYEAACNRSEEKVQMMLNAKLAADEASKGDDKKTVGASASWKKGLSPALLERIRQRQVANEARQMIRTNESDSKIKQLRNLPEIARPLPLLFNSERKTSLPMNFITKKLIENSTNITNAMAMENQLKLLAEKTEPWLTFASVGETKYVKLDKKRKISDIFAVLANEIKQAEKNL